MGALVQPGSSPLARGLHEVAGDGDGVARIIPARAGFTAVVEADGLPSADHPRSRGVYCARTSRTRSVPGSSPLARGLPAEVGGVDDDAGIIPARAGFTGEVMGAMSAAWDHPRSRGVYEAARSWAASRLGSSPLARGLLWVAGGDAKAVGIIPARAGFTGPSRTGSAGRSDHPRSRGVYRGIFAPPVTMSGSSPLARGLPAAPHDRAMSVRIIPARAGFTAA